MTAPTQTRVGAYVFHPIIQKSIRPRGELLHRAGRRGFMVFSDVLSHPETA